MKIVTVVGARPQFIKAATVSREISHQDNVNEMIVHTGQHFDDNMSEVFFNELDIPKPTYNLGIGNLSHGAMTGRQIEAIESILLKEKPNWVLVYGDTNSTLAAAIASVKLHIPVAHVEAGLRSYNRTMPEEINRVLTDHASDLLFAPTEIAVKNLALENIAGMKVKLVGDVMYDAALYYSVKAVQESSILDVLEIKAKGYVLATLHRQENTDDPLRLKNIIFGLEQSPLPIIMPLHPRTKKRLESLKIKIKPPIWTIEPVGYLDMIMLEQNAIKIATDSGGVQKEAFFFQVPCITLREETEWVETIEMGWNKLVGADHKKISSALSEESENKRNAKLQPYGTGDTATKIVNLLKF